MIKESAESLNQRPWHEIQLVLRTYGLKTYELDDQWSHPSQLMYCDEQIEEAGDELLLDLHAYLLGEDAAPELPHEDRPWGDSPVAVFISHRHEDAAFVGMVRDLLRDRYGIDAFVAHNDISPSRKWRDTIRAALASCDFAVAVLHEKFHESQWCDQEVGWALGRGIPVMPVRRQVFQGERRDGFLEEHQDLVLGPAPQFGSGEWWLAEQIFERVLSEPKTRERGFKALAEAFVNSFSFDSTRKLWAKVAEVENWQPEQLRRLEYAVATNRQVYEANLDGQPIPDLVKALIERFEPPAPPAQPKQDPWEPPF